MRVGVFGGSFDPPHLGHAIVAQYARERLALDRLLFVPARQPPHKRGRVLAPGRLRADMVRAMIAGEEAFELDELELERGGPSYTIDTVRALAARETVDELVLLVGADQFAEFHTWRAPEAIAEIARIAVLARAGGEYEEPPVDVPHARVPVPRVDISSSEIRSRVAAGMSVRYLVVGPVLEIMEREGLYRAVAHAGEPR